MIREDCRQQVKLAQRKQNDVSECVGNANNLGALGAFVGLDEEILTLEVFLTRIAKLTVVDRAKKNT